MGRREAEKKRQNQERSEREREIEGDR